MTRKEFLQSKINDPKWSKTLRPLKLNGEKLPPYPLMTMAQKYKYNNIYKIGYLDIETSRLTGDFGFMISYCLLIRDTQTEKTKVFHEYITKKDFKYAEKKNNHQLIDEKILYQLVEDISECDLLIGHWFIGKHRHDIPFIRTRCAINKVPGFPHNKMVRYGDTQKWSSQIHRLRNYGLDTIADAYDLSIRKTRLSTHHWGMAAQFGTKESIKYIDDHCVKDVKITYKVHKHIEEYVNIPSQYH